jgi:hypothetical protein
MEHLWSPAGATGGNQWQMGRARKPLKQADPQPVATHGNRFAAHGKEGVDGSSPSEGSAKAPHVAFAFTSTCRFSRVRWVWSRLWSFRVQNGVTRRRAWSSCPAGQALRALRAPRSGWLAAGPPPVHPDRRRRLRGAARGRGQRRLCRASARSRWTSIR